MATSLDGSYDAWLVALSVLMAIVASYAALDLAGRVTAARGWARATWLASGAFAMGVGIWSMHYIGMLAFHLPVPVLYDLPTVVLSLLAAVLASAVALWVVSRRDMDLPQAVPGSVVMGLGIAAMHYTGMGAMRVPAALRYDPWLLALSVVIAIVVSFVALWRAFRLRGDEARGWWWRKVGSAVLMGIAIPSMHYTGMAAAHFTPTEALVQTTHAIGITSLGTAAVAVSTLMVLGLAIITSVIDRRLSAQASALATGEAALRAHERFLRDVIDADPHFVFAKDWDGRFTLANKAVAQVYGITPDALVGKTDADFNSNRQEVENFLRDDREVIASGRPKLIPEEPVTNAKTGETRWFETVKVPLISADGTARQVVGVATDVTQRKRLEEQLRQSQKMEAIGRLAGGIAHDFNNLLTAIIGYAELLMADGGAADSRRGDVAEIKRAAERAAGLTQQLLAFSRKQLLQPKVLDLNALVRETQKLLRRLLGEDIELQTVAATDLDAVEADPGQLGQVIMNLAVNARDAMPRGGQLTIETANVVLDDAAVQQHVTMRPGRYVMLAVSDTGVGMDADTKAHLFEPFFTTKEAGKGTGLGLATVYGIVKQSGGYIWAYSEPGRGATFKIYLPPVAARAEAVRSPVAPSAATHGSETVLVVEDEEAVRRLSCRVLESHGYTVLAAGRGDQALHVASRHTGPIQLLVTDVVMPGMSGRELAKRLSSLRPATKVLYLSGYTDDAIVRHGVLEPGVSFLQKPFTPAALARKVREVLDGG